MDYEALDIAPGSEQYLPFAQHLCRRMKEVLKACGLEQGYRHFKTPDGAGTVYIRTRFSAGAWYDYIKIEGGRGFFVFNVFMYPFGARPVTRDLSLNSANARFLLPYGSRAVKFIWDPDNTGVQDTFQLLDRGRNDLVTGYGTRLNPSKTGYYERAVFVADPLWSFGPPLFLSGPEVYFRHSYVEPETGAATSILLAYRSISSVSSPPIFTVSDATQLTSNTHGVTSFTGGFAVSKDGRGFVAGSVGSAKASSRAHMAIDYAASPQVVVTPILQPAVYGTSTSTHSTSEFLNYSLETTSYAAGAELAYRNRGNLSSGSTESYIYAGAIDIPVSYGVDKSGVLVSIVARYSYEGSLLRASDTDTVYAGVIPGDTLPGDWSASLIYSSTETKTGTASVAYPRSVAIALPGGVEKEFLLYSDTYADTVSGVAAYSEHRPGPLYPSTREILSETGTRTHSRTREYVTGALKIIYADASIPVLICEYMVETSAVTASGSISIGSAFSGTSTNAQTYLIEYWLLVGDTAQLLLTDSSREPVITSGAWDPGDTAPSVGPTELGGTSATSNSTGPVITPNDVTDHTYWTPPRTLKALSAVSKDTENRYSVVVRDTENWVISLVRVRNNNGDAINTFEVFASHNMNAAKVRSAFLDKLAEYFAAQGPSYAQYVVDLQSGALSGYEIRLDSPGVATAI